MYGDFLSVNVLLFNSLNNPSASHNSNSANSENTSCKYEGRIKTFGSVSSSYRIDVLFLLFPIAIQFVKTKKGAYVIPHESIFISSVFSGLSYGM